jgi:hypothetical protein
MPLFANWGQVAQLIIALLALMISARPAFQSMSKNRFFSFGAVIFYLMVGSVLLSMVILIRQNLVVGTVSQSTGPPAPPSNISVGELHPFPASSSSSSFGVGVLGWIMFGMIVVCFLVYAYRSRGTGLEADPPLASPQDKASIEKIKVLFRAYIVIPSDLLLQLANNLVSRFQVSTDEKDQTIGLLFYNEVLVRCNQAYQVMIKALNAPSELPASSLQDCLGKFFEAYQNLVRHVHRLKHITPESPEKREEYVIWKSRHDEFHTKLREMVAADDFSKLREELRGKWNDRFDGD